MKIEVRLLGYLWSFWMVLDPTRGTPTEAGQLILSSSDTPGPQKTNNANLVFASFAGLLQQWPNTFAFSGHSIIPGLIPRSTLLYHGTNDPRGPPTEGFEWLAFDPEMSYSVITHTRSGEVDLYTFVATRALRVIYFDGQSASLGTPGFMDAQYALINGSVPEHFPNKGHYLEDEYARATELCKIGNKYGFEGVVRMNTGFEVLWCDFAKGIKLIDKINATDPYSKKTSGPTMKRQVDTIFNKLPEKRRESKSPFYSRSGWSSSHSGARHFFAPGEARVILDPTGFISFYDGLESLDSKRRADGTSAGPRSRHRLYGISAEDARLVQGRLAEVLRRKNSEDWRMDPGQPDWRALVQSIVERYSPPLGELKYLLNRADMSASEQVIEARGLAYDMIMPSLDFSDWDRKESQWLSRGVRRCAAAYTSAPLLLSELNHSIQLIIRAIEGTMERICDTIYKLFWQAMQLSLPTNPSSTPNSTLETLARSKIPEWREQVDGLQKWLGWSTWAHCEPLCKITEICMPPMWPYIWGKDMMDIIDRFPYCVNSSLPRFE
ncbi:hypothetical protein Pst134EB_012102 [Puccinia striiformis f. sp. tritici]|uniref:Uncharacterized protein n=1 Tax=Puccinia striiformis f. sp. tritici PST-78 TaxID=1165861 RepID=A0A0L0UX57_9BASI|nr:hypothetical protein Pst134EB_012102 [Puccinia striiformis f. sp. tritici]KNE91501.1 hypothetical protein PSTG_15097 [Puccinia striiformis f. sp. tritici PST-78]